MKSYNPDSKVNIVSPETNLKRIEFLDKQLLLAFDRIQDLEANDHELLTKIVNMKREIRRNTQRMDNV